MQELCIIRNETRAVVVFRALREPSAKGKGRLTVRCETGESQMTLRYLASLKRIDGHKPKLSLEQIPYWWQSLEASDGNIALPEKIDVAIVGSGFTGLSAALTLVRRGRSVAVLDSREIGFGASTRNGGQIGSGNQKFRVETLIGMHGEKKAVALLREGVRMLDYTEELIRAENIDCRFVRCGRFRGAVRREHYDAMARDMDDLRRYTGVESFAVPRCEQHKEVATDFFHGGSVLPNDAALHPGLYHSGLVERLKNAGAVLKGFSPVKSIERRPDGFEVRTPNEALRARDVIVATNGYTDHLDSHFQSRVVPIESAIIATAPMPPDLLTSLLPSGRVYGNTARVFSYFRSAPDEPRILWGGRVGRLHRKDSPSAYGHLARDLLKVFPDLDEVPVTHGWSGRIGYTFDELPHLGKTPDGIHYAMGYCGTGVSRSTYFGHKIALKLVDDPQGSTEFDSFEFPRHTFHAFAKPAVPFVESWYRLRDAWNF